MNDVVKVVVMFVVVVVMMNGAFVGAARADAFNAASTE